MSVSTMFSKARDAHHGCNAALCPNGKCSSTGECQDRLPVVEAPPLSPKPTAAVYGHGGTLVGYERQGSGYDPGARGYELQGRASAPPRVLIAFTGLAGSGKSTAAKHLCDAHGFTRIRFAGPLKDMMRALGLTEAEIEGDRKEQPCELLGGKTPRYAMQTIGTEWGRDMIASDLWIRAFNAALAKVPEGVPVVVDDCRFPNEADAVVAAGGVLVRVVRPGAGAGAAGHSSEGQQLPAVETIDNTGPVAMLLANVDCVVRDLSWRDNAPA